VRAKGNISGNSPPGPVRPSFRPHILFYGYFLVARSLVANCRVDCLEQEENAVAIGNDQILQLSWTDGGENSGAGNEEHQSQNGCRHGEGLDYRAQQDKVDPKSNGRTVDQRPEPDSLITDLVYVCLHL